MLDSNPRPLAQKSGALYQWSLKNIMKKALTLNCWDRPCQTSCDRWLAGWISRHSARCPHPHAGDAGTSSSYKTTRKLNLFSDNFNDNKKIKKIKDVNNPRRNSCSPSLILSNILLNKETNFWCAKDSCRDPSGAGLICWLRIRINNSPPDMALSFYRKS